MTNSDEVLHAGYHVYQRSQYHSIPRIPWTSSISFCVERNVFRTLAADRRWWRNVQVICRRVCCAMLGSPAIDNMLRVLSFFRFPFVDFFRSNKPCVIVFQIITLCSLSFLHRPQIHSSRLPISWLVFLLFFEFLSI